jgi:hypothetical protein
VVQVVGGVRHANANANAASSITNAHSNITRRDMGMHIAAMRRMRVINIDSNLARPDANVHASSINVDAAIRHFNSSVTNFEAAQQCLQQQQQQQRQQQQCDWRQ